MRSLVLALLCCASTSARADCIENDPEVGFRLCRAPRHDDGFGFWYEGGVAVTRFVPTPVGTPIEAIGGTARAIVRNGMWHMGLELGYAMLTDAAPHEYGQPIIGSVMTNRPVVYGGDVAQAKLVAGRRTNAGPFTVGGELAAGMMFASYDGNQTPMDEMHYLVELRGRIDLWLAPQISLGVQSGIDVLDLDYRSVAVLVGYHLREYDGTR